MTMRAQLIFLALSLMMMPLAACGDDGTGTDGGMTDGSTDSGTPPADSGMGDTGTPPVDSGVDSGAPCTTGCEFIDVVSGATHSCALRANGTVWCWGGNIDGTLGDGRERHEDCGSAGSTEIQDCSPPVEVIIVEDATHLSARGGSQNCVVRESGGAWCWGRESVGPASGGEAIKNFEPVPRAGLESLETVSRGFNHTCGIAAGQAVCIGQNGSGQIGDGTRDEARVAHTVAMPTGLVDVQVSTGPHSGLTCALTVDAAYCWGNNADSQLGDGVADHAGGCETYMGSGYDCALSAQAVTLPTGVMFTQIAPGGSHVCAVGDDGSLYCWGANNYGQLGLGDQVGVGLPTLVIDATDGDPVVQVETGPDFSCARMTSGKVFCFGDNAEGQLGDDMPSHGVGVGDCTAPMATDCSFDPVEVMGLAGVTDIGAGRAHMCALRSTGDVVCWGRNTKKQLGDGTRDRRYAPVTVMDLGN